MKNITKALLGIILIITICLTICPKTYAAMDPKLSDIVNIFNACSTVKKYNQNPETMNMYATSYSNDEDKIYTLTVRVDENGESRNLVYKLEDNILTANYTGGDATERAYWPLVTNIVIDALGQYHGYAEGEMYNTLNSSEIANYTLDKEGLMISNNSPNLYLAQVDITKTVPLLDTNTYVKVEDLKELKESLAGDAIARYKKGKIVFYKYTVDDKDIVIIGEQNGFSYIINRSIYSILEVMFGGTEAVEYYKENYPEVKADKQFAGFKIEVNPIRTSTEENVLSTDSSYKFARITIDRAAVKEALEDKNKKGGDDGETPTNPGDPEKEVPSDPTNPGTPGKSETPTSGTLPKTGGETNVILVIAYAVFGLALISLIALLIKLKEKRN